MLRPAMFALAAATLVLVGSIAASAQCLTLSPTLPCSQLTKSQPSFGLGAPKVPANRSDPTVNPLRQASPAAKESRGLDCQMSKPIDPNFHSAMPVIKPNPNVALPMRVIPVPSCKP